MKMHLQLASGVLAALVLGGVPAFAEEPGAPPAQASAANAAQESEKPKVAAAYTELRVCGENDGCAKSGARWTGRALLSMASRGTPREFTWKTTVPDVTHGRYEVSPKPFPQSPGSTPKLLLTGDAGKPENGRFTLKIPDAARYYVRVIPMAGDQPAGRSNIVMVLHKEPKPAKAEKPAEEKSAE